jgi:hypothetical protein
MTSNARFGLASAHAVAVAIAIGCSDNSQGRETADGASPTTELRGLVAAAITAYDRQVVASCPCYVKSAAYESTEECAMWLKSEPDWVSCATAALEELDSPELRRALRCLETRSDANTQCLAPKSCDDEARSDCMKSVLQCFTDNGAAIVHLDLACPDISLLPRQPAADADDEAP